MCAFWRFCTSPFRNENVLIPRKANFPETGHVYHPHIHCDMHVLTESPSHFVVFSIHTLIDRYRLLVELQALACRLCGAIHGRDLCPPGPIVLSISSNITPRKECVITRHDHITLAPRGRWAESSLNSNSRIIPKCFFFQVKLYNLVQLYAKATSLSWIYAVLVKSHLTNINHRVPSPPRRAVGEFSDNTQHDFIKLFGT